jgi:rhamnogalacturonan endolyase
MNPHRAGREIWQPYESPGTNGQKGAALIDARTGARIFTVAEASADVGRGMAADVDPRYKGYEMWASRGNLYSCTGTSITTSKPSINFAVWWDADLQRELLDNITITKWNYSSSSSSTLLTATGCASNNSTKATPALSGDILGDWREEVILRTSDNTALRIFTTTITATNRIYTLMHDPQYRVAIAWQNSAYNQPPHPGFYLGGDMAAPPVPNIYLPGSSNGSGLTIQENSSGFCSVDGTIDNNNAGYTGTGFANTSNAAGSGINWRISVPAAGSYTLTWRYSNGGGTDRPGSLLINGSTAVSSVSFPATPDWTTWTTASATVSLNAGNADIRLQATGSVGLGNIDNINIQGASAATAVNCTSAARAGTTAAPLSDAISITPNPSSRVFNINTSGAFRYMIYDQLGRLVEKGQGHNRTSIGQKLTPGTYTVQVEAGNKLKLMKIVKVENQ